MEQNSQNSPTILLRQLKGKNFRQVNTITELEAEAAALYNCK